MPLVHVDSNRVEQVLVNLIINALKHSQSGNSVEVKINNYLDGQLCIFTCKVVDSGSGIEPQN
jgi:signal transduction histidine kinase